MNIRRVIKTDVTSYIWDALKVDRWLLLLDLTLIVVFIFLILAEAQIVVFHVAFILLIFGAFYWKFRAFVFRTTFWITVIAVVLFTSIFEGKIPFEEIFEIPALTVMLALVYIISRQRSRAVDALQERTDQLSMLLEVSNQIALTRRLEPLLGLILDHLKTVVDYESATIFKLDGKILTRLIYRGPTEQDGDTPLIVSLENTHIGDKLLVDQVPVIITDVLDDTLLARDFRKMYGNQAKKGRGNGYSWIGIPLTAQSEVIGVLAIQHGTPLHHYSPNHVDLVLGFANQATVAIETARHYEQVHALATIEERQRLARDLHDAVSQTLFSASLSAEVLPRLWELNPTEARRCLDEIYYLNRSALTEMRTLLLELRPEALVELELRDLLDQLAESIGNRVRLPITIKAEYLGRVAPDVQIALYRISQEALNNVVKHAAASQVTVCLTPLSPTNGGNHGKGLELRIADDGRGFDPKRVVAASLGLGIMRERAEAIGAEFRIESEIGRGTEVAVIWMGAS